MRIESLEVQAIRGFNERVLMEFKAANLIILYGPNGHGKTSVFDAIEWGLTGEINRFSQESTESKRAHFIRNLHSNKSDKAYVRLGIKLPNNERFYVTRECLETREGKTDYGEFKLVILKENSKEKARGEVAEKLLQSWLVQKEWESKIKSPIKMLGMTHVLSQEKISGFLRDMEQRERYDAISNMLGTDYFEKYRESFNSTRKQLSRMKQELENKYSLYKSDYEEKTKKIENLEKEISENYNSDFQNELKKYVEFYPSLEKDKDDVNILLNHIETNMKRINLLRNDIRKEKNILLELEIQLPNAVKIREDIKKLEFEEKLLTEFKYVIQLQQKIKQIENQAVAIEEEKSEIQTLVKSQTKSREKRDTLLKRKESAISLSNLISKQLELLLANSGLMHLKDIKNKCAESQYQDLVDSFRSIDESNETISRKKKAQIENNEQLISLNESISEIQSTDKLLNEFLSSLKQYLVTGTNNIEECPACGTPEISKDHILVHINRKQQLVDEKLPKLEQIRLTLKTQMKSTDDSIKEEKQKILLKERLIKQITDNLKSKIKLIEIDINNEKNSIDALQEKIESIRKKSNEFYKTCETLGIEVNNNVIEELKRKEESCLEKLGDIEKSIRNVLKFRDYFSEEIRNSYYKIDNLGKFEAEILDKKREKNLNISELERLCRESKILVVDLDTFDISLIKERIKELDFENIEINEIETTSVSLQCMIKYNLDRQNLLKLQSEHAIKKEALNSLEIKLEYMTTDIRILTELEKKSIDAIAKLNEKMFSKLKITVQNIFAQLNSHPVFTHLDFTEEKFRNANVLLVNVLSKIDDNEVKANAPYVLSSAQINSIALSIFLAMSLQQRWSSLKLLGLDDPIQSMDEVNIVSFIDLMRLLVNKHNKQIIISTHDYSFYTLLLKKFRHFDVATVEYGAYGENGPSYINLARDGGIVKYRKATNYENEKGILLKQIATE